MNQREFEARHAVWQAIEARESELIELIAALVHQQSLLGNEAGVQAIVATEMENSGLAVESWDLDESLLKLPNAGNSGVAFPVRPNVTGKRAGSGSGKSLILNGHIDVVSPAPTEHWTHDPWGAEVIDQRMYGRGAFDMKCGVAINIFLPRLLHDLGISLDGDLTVHSVIEEECTGNGTLAASLRDTADAAIVTEPMWPFYSAGHVGVIWFRVAVQGRSAHVAYASQGVNAIVKMAPIILALRELDDELNLQIHPLWASQSHPINLNVGIVQGGDWPSNVPGSCEIRCRVSFFPGTDVAEVRQRIEAQVATASASDAWLVEHPPVVTYEGFNTNGCLVDLDEPFLQLLRQAHSEVAGNELVADYEPAVNDMRYYVFAGTPATTYGPGGGNAHAADEWLDLSSLIPVAKTLSSFILDWCGVS